MASSQDLPDNAASTILKPSDPVPEWMVPVEGPNFDEPMSLNKFLRSYERIGFQANSLGKAIEVVDRMVSKTYTRCHVYDRITLLSAQMASVRRPN